ncbi:hypothetical protein NSP55_24125, partial [Salmonella enterica]|nr:hypothetical protein [Salmonella enterica]
MAQRSPTASSTVAMEQTIPSKLLERMDSLCRAAGARPPQYRSRADNAQASPPRPLLYNFNN